ncbi:polysaccharide biosynthesis tyrosine autokinase [Sphingomonas sp. PP-CC-3G-468]|uniref:GumC family protein n=1 Tax=Sphingomonas sp. PP-CC-3G-468 TaxID=2135656 RepID=UPI0010510CD9|nr:polysaccharide biosynthesis tyrosine autokinase [Sphingomonas sp. PP-CC-3G-468]TCM07508.1 capsular exopolysaccharide synthesis family protein [Sphingomonas sp. PP-CC-3G-468]
MAENDDQDGSTLPSRLTDGSSPAPLRRPAVTITRTDAKPRVIPQFDLADLLRVVIKWKWLILGAVLLGIATAVAVTTLSTRIYRASATLEINTTPLEVMGNNRGVMPKLRSEDQFLQTQYGLLRSRSLAERVATALKLASDPAFAGTTPDPAKRTRAAVGRLTANLDVTPVRGSNLVQLSYTDPDPARATLIVNGFATGFMAANADRRFEATAYARNFLQNRLNATKQRLEASERELVAYAQQKGIVQLDSGGQGGSRGGGDGPTSATGDSLSSQSLVAINGALSSAIGERITAEQRYRQAAANGSSSDALLNPTVQALRAERAKLEADYRERLATFKPDFPDMVALRNRIQEIDISLRRETGEVSSSLRSAYLAALGREAELRGQVSALRSNVLDLRGRGIGYTILQREVETNRTLYDALLQRFKEVGVAGGLGESQAGVVDAAIQPSSPFRPSPIRNLAVGMIAGLVVGLGIAFAIEFIDDTIKTPEDVAAKLNLPLLGVVPKLARGRTIRDELASPRSSVAEAYYSIKTALQFTDSGSLPRSLLVTSSRAAEGKSSTSLALAQNLARTGLQVLLIDADLRKPSFMAKTGSDIGLSRLLISNESIAGHVVQTNTPNLYLLPSGTVPPNPAELLATSRIRAILRDAVDRFGVVVVDAPPVLGLADAPVLGSICEATVMVIEAGSIRRAIALGALSRLVASGTRIVGVTLTKYNPKAAGYGDGYGYGYGYGATYGEGSKTPMLDIAP